MVDFEEEISSDKYKPHACSDCDEIHTPNPPANKIHVSCFDTPNFTNNGINDMEDLMSVDMDNVEIIAPYLITPQWVKDKVRKWGVDSPKCAPTTPEEIEAAKPATTATPPRGSSCTTTK